MEWFNGGVSNAIAACRQQKALFIVYIHDDSQGSRSTDETWQSAEVKESLRDNKYVALKVAKDSLEYHQFSQLYMVFMCPSIFCVGMTGKLLVVMNGPQSSAQLRDKLTEAFEKLQTELSGGQNPTATAALATPTDAPTETLQNGPVSTSTSEGATGGGSSVSGGVASSTAAATAGDSKEEKLLRYQEKIKQRREERAENEFQHEKQQEIKRRQQGKEMSTFQQQQEELRNQTWIHERKRQKEEAKKAREEIKAKLEQDRLERRARQRASEAAASEVRQRSVGSSPDATSSGSSVSTAGSCRIQLRLPAGRTTVVEMNKTDTLSALRETVAQELNTKPDNVILTSMYPRNELVPELDSQSMVQLQLVPSGVLIVRVKTSGISLPSGGGVAGSLWAALVGLLQLIVSFLTFIKNALTGVFSGGNQASNSGSGSERQNQRRPVPYGDGGGRVRKFRQEDFQDEEDDDKKKSTYNGNSTQQQ